MTRQRADRWTGRGVGRDGAGAPAPSGGAPAVFLALSDSEAPEPADQRPLGRRASTALVAGLVALAAPLLWTGNGTTAHEAPKAVATKQLAAESDDDR